MSDEQNDFLYDFLDECEEYLTILNNKMLEAESAIKQGIAMSDTDLQSMFRATHTIKGTASFIGLSKIVDLTNTMETLLAHLKNKSIVLNNEIINLLFSAFDTLTSLFSSLRERGEESGEVHKDITLIEGALQRYLTGIDKKDGQTPARPQSTQEQSASREHAPSEEISNPAEAISVENVSPTIFVPEDLDAEDINKTYLEQFIIELDQNLESFEQALLVLENQPENRDVLNNIFRYIHTIKGSAGIVNAQKIMEVAQRMENILSFFRDQRGKMDPDYVAVLFKGFDVIIKLSSALKENSSLVGVNIFDICAELDQSNNKLLSSAPEVPKREVWSIEGQKNNEQIKELFAYKNLSCEEMDQLQAAYENRLSFYHIKMTFEDTVVMCSMKVMIIEERLKKNGVLIATRPHLEHLDGSGNKAVCGIIFASNANLEAVNDILNLGGVVIILSQVVDLKNLECIIKTNTSDALETTSQAQPEHLQAVSSQSGVVLGPTVTGKSSSKVKAAPLEISTIRIDSKKLDTLMNLSGELVIIRAQFARLVNILNNNVSQHREIYQLIEHIEGYLDTVRKELNSLALTHKADQGRDNGYVKYERTVSQLIDMFNSLNNLVLNINMIDNIHTLDETTSKLEKISSNIQSGVMQTRMIPIEGVFSRFKRIVRDIAREINKDVELIIEGQETELDKKIVDSLGDPLTHMIRNSIDHGLEDSQERLRAGKSKVGTVYLKASHRGNNICIELGDDGRGINPDMLVEKALHKELITAEQAERMSEKDKLDLIFLPGFSTAERVTGLSGRGVGMDVVRGMIKSVNGSIDIDTQPGEGTNFILKIPLTLAIIQALLVTIGEEIYAFPLETVTEIVRVTKEEIYSVDGNDTIKLRDHALSLLELEKIIKVRRKQDRPETEEKNRKVVVITDGEMRLGIIVDELVGKEEIVIKSFTEHFSKVKGLTGASILADGTVALILDSATIIKESR